MKTEKLLLGLFLTLFVFAANGQVKYVHSSFGNNPKMEINISWGTADTTDTSSYVLYGIDTMYGSKSYNHRELIVLKGGTRTLLVHHIKLIGLNPGTKYHYKCGGDISLSGDCTFQTAPEGNTPFTFAVHTDTHIDSVPTSSRNVYWKNAANFLKDQNINFLLLLGDNVINYDVPEASRLIQWMNFFESGKSIFEKVAVMPIIGSHDMEHWEAAPWGVSNVKYHTSFFRLPYNGSPAYANRWFSFDYSNCVFANMDCAVIGAWHPGMSIQMPWMDSIYKNTKKTWKLATWHECPYTTGIGGDFCLTPFLSNLLAVSDTYNVATVFNGHSHAYEFTHPILHIGNPPVVSKATVNGSKAVANHTQGTIFYTGGTNPANVKPAAEFTLDRDSIRMNYTLLLATVYDDSIVYKVTTYADRSPFVKGDVRFTYKIINDVPGKKFNLNVSVSGGNGTTNPTGTVQYMANENASITATPNAGYLFDNWTGADVPVGKENDNPLVVKMDTNKTLVAHFKAAPVHTLTVNSGTGSGSYSEGIQVSIVANAPATGKVFDKWTGDITNIANINASSTTITMPASIVSITATYKDAPPNTYTLTVISGTGSGNYTAATVVNISANAPAAGKVFDKWTGDVTGIVNVNASSTTIAMPSANATVTATYKDEFPSYTLTVNEGTGSGSYIAGTVVTITANAAPIDKIFNKWTGDVTGISNIYASTSTITMSSANVAITATFKDGTNAIAAEKSMVSIYPNPTTDILNILSQFPIDEIKIVDLTGKILLIENPAGKNSITLSLTQLEKGMYIIEIKLISGNTIQKTIIITIVRTLL